MKTPGPDTGRQRDWVVVALLCAAAAAILLRLSALPQPLGIDQGLWASAVLGLDRGQTLYVDVWEQRPPGIYLAYWSAFRLLGWEASSIVLLDVAAAAATTLLLFAIVAHAADRRSAAGVAAFYALMTMPPWLYRYGGINERSVSETFIVPLVCIAWLSAARYRRRGSTVAVLGIGLAVGGAMAFKPNAGLYLPAILIWALWPGAGGRPGHRRLSAVIAAGAGCAVVPAALTAWLWSAGALPEAKIAVLDFNRYYLTEGYDFARYLRLFLDRTFLWFKTEPLWFAGVLGGLAALGGILRDRRGDPLAGLAVCWASAALAVIVVYGMAMFNSYFMQAQAPLAVAAVWWMRAWWPRQAASPVVGAVVLAFLSFLIWEKHYVLAVATTGWMAAWWSRHLALRALTAMAVAFMAFMLWERNYLPRIVRTVSADLAYQRGHVSRNDYLANFGGYDNQRGYSARAHDELADYIKSHSSPEDRVFLFGINGAGLYFLSDRLTAHRFLRVNFFIETTFPDPRFRLEPVLDELQTRRPLYLIFERLHSESIMGKAADALPQQPAVLELLRGYDLETTIEDFTLYRRR